MVELELLAPTLNLPDDEIDSAIPSIELRRAGDLPGTFGIMWQPHRKNITFGPVLVENGGVDNEAASEVPVQSQVQGHEGFLRLRCRHLVNRGFCASSSLRDRPLLGSFLAASSRPSESGG